VESKAKVRTGGETIEKERERKKDPGYQFWKALREETFMFSRGIREGE